jgi:tRNA1Val (adenine37-N6)-methyltransferase
MARNKSKFYFKQFSIYHENSSMKVGTDGVLLGAWAAQNDSPTSILDVGTGSGLIALMMAQRFPNTFIKGIDIHADSIEDAKYNVQNFPFNHQVEMDIADFVNFKSDREFDFIVSNPPYFFMALLSKKEDKNRVRHQGHLNMKNFIQNAVYILSSKGKVALILPTKEILETIEIAQENELFISRICDIKSSENQEVIRKMVEFSKEQPLEVIQENLVIYQSERVYTDEYKELTKDFYLNF